MLSMMVGNLHNLRSRRLTTSQLVKSVESRAPPDMANFMALETHVTPPILTATECCPAQPGPAR